MEQFCLCGAQAGYPHIVDCPFPYFGTLDRKIAEWGAEQERLRDLQMRENESHNQVLYDYACGYYD